MTIKNKLGLNVIIVIVAIAAVSATSFVGMKFVKGKLYYLTERSTPFQMRTEQFEKSIQRATTELIKMANVGNKKEFDGSRSEAGKAVSDVEKLQANLDSLSGESKSNTTYTELAAIATELGSTTEARLKAEEESNAAYRVITEKIRETDTKLKGLDAKIKALQSTRAGAYLNAVKDTDKISARLKSIETLMTNLTKLQLLSHELQAAKTAKVQQGMTSKMATLAKNIQQNGNVKEAKNLKGEVAGLVTKTEELARVVQGSPERARAIGEDIDDKMDAIMSVVEDMSQTIDESHDVVYGKQGTLLNYSNIASGILSHNSDLMTMGTSLNGLSARLFIIDAATDAEAVKKEIAATFAKMAVVQKNLESELRKLNATKETQLLKSADDLLRTVHTTLFGKNGAIEKIEHRSQMQKQAAAAMGRLREIVARQAERGKQTLTMAQGDQEKAISSVNKMVNFSLLFIAIIGSAAIAFGAIFGLWVYKSIASPLQQLLAVSGKVAEGDLTTELGIQSSDEVGQVQSSMASMVVNLRGMLGKISEATGRIANSSEELSTTAIALKKGSDDQTTRIQQSAVAIEEMTQTTNEVARNTAEASDSAEKMKTVAGAGKKAMHLTAEELDRFAVVIKEAVTVVESVGKQSEEIGNVIGLITDIADQTNLLALNAAIEAARAGDQGRGFAVVADNVRQLAERTTEATHDITSTVKTMQSSVSHSVKFMKEARSTIGNVQEQVHETLDSIDSIVGYVDDVTTMVHKIAVAAEEQSAGTGDISKNMDEITEITKEVANSFHDINNSSGDLSRLAADLNSMVHWFRI